LAEDWGVFVGTAWQNKNLWYNSRTVWLFGKFLPNYQYTL
jgi:hypothetical protein